MTVNMVADDTFVECVWHNENGDLQSASFDPAVLVLESVSPGKPIIDLGDMP